MDRREYFNQVFADDPNASLPHRLITRVAGRVVPSLVDAFALPGDVLTGKVPLYDEDGRISRDVIQRSFDLAGTVAGGTGFGTKSVDGPVVGSGFSNLDDLEAELTKLLSEGPIKAPKPIHPDDIYHYASAAPEMKSLNDVWAYVDTLPKEVQIAVEKKMVDDYHKKNYQPEVQNKIDEEFETFDDADYSLVDENTTAEDLELQKEVVALLGDNPDYYMKKVGATQDLQKNANDLWQQDQIAKAQKVPMRPVSPLAYDPPDVRLDRAKEMGFDIDEPWYHGTGAVFDEFDPKKSDEKASFFTLDPKIAENYVSSGDNVQQTIPVYIRKDNIAEADWSDYSEDMQYNNYSMKALIDQFRDAGVDAVRIKNIRDVGGMQEQLAVLKPEIIRSRFAAFDPSLKDSAKYMSGLAGAGVLAKEFGAEEER